MGPPRVPPLTAHVPHPRHGRTINGRNGHNRRNGHGGELVATPRRSPSVPRCPSPSRPRPAARSAHSRTHAAVSAQLHARHQPRARLLRNAQLQPHAQQQPHARLQRHVQLQTHVQLQPPAAPPLPIYPPSHCCWCTKGREAGEGGEDLSGGQRSWRSSRPFPSPRSRFLPLCRLSCPRLLLQCGEVAGGGEVAGEVMGVAGGVLQRQPPTSSSSLSLPPVVVLGGGGMSLEVKAVAGGDLQHHTPRPPHPLSSQFPATPALSRPRLPAAPVAREPIGPVAREPVAPVSRESVAPAARLAAELVTPVARVPVAPVARVPVALVAHVPAASVAAHHLLSAHVPSSSSLALSFFRCTWCTPSGGVLHMVLHCRQLGAASHALFQSEPTWRSDGSIVGLHDERFFDANYAESDAARIRYAVLLLRGPAMDWWRVIVTSPCTYEPPSQEGEPTGPTWENGVAERRIGLVMEVARTSMIHAVAPHFLWPFAVRYAAHQLNLYPRVSLPETSHTLRWTGKVGDATVFRVRGSRAFVRDTSADKLSSRAIPCIFLGFPPDAPGWQFYHPTSRRVLSS
ncbi:unnamed protein product [Closterium sp. NIES-53]